MKAFLEYVAEDMIRRWGNDLSRTVVVFPNKRAQLFLNQYLLKANGGSPLWSPVYTTITDMFLRHSQYQEADSLKLICDLHKSYVSVTKSIETLDQFFAWGQVMLSDFDDIDKNMADARQVFANIRDIHEFDDISYLTEDQKSVLKSFFSNFTDGHESELRRRFLHLWCHLYDIYTDFNARLSSQQLGYQGAIYRRVVEDSSVCFGYDRYIFVGFNLLQKVERRLFDRLQSDGKAFFYWDFDRYYMPTSHGHETNEAGRYISQYLKYYPNALDISEDAIYDNFSMSKDITYLSSPTENLQARYISEWLTSHPERISAGNRTAIVMCNEQLLPAVIHCLPSDVHDVNITTGYPLSQSPFCSLIDKLFDLQTDGRLNNNASYRTSIVRQLLRHPYMPYISESYSSLLDDINANLTFSKQVDALCLDDDLTLVFNPLDPSHSQPSTKSIIKWMSDIITLIGVHSRDVEDPLFKESLFCVFTSLSRVYDLIYSGDLLVDIHTLRNVVGQLLHGASVPFHGEPAIGIQVMGLLETRNLDFDHLLVLSCNEGFMPKGVNDTSLIPHSVRKANELTTIENKVAIYSYYYNRLLQRPADISVAYNNSTMGTKSNEMSRFMLQHLLESNHSVRRLSLMSGQMTLTSERHPVAKDAEVVRRLKERFEITANNGGSTRPLLSPTAINKYMYCPMRFYYNYVCGINEYPDEDITEIDSMIFGDIFHYAAEQMYRSICQHNNSSSITTYDLNKFRQNKKLVESLVDDAFRHIFFNIKNGAHPNYNGLQLINREVIMRYVYKLIDIDMQMAPFEILGLETKVCKVLDVGSGSLQMQTSIGGIIDRLDRVQDHAGMRIRVVDYKTSGKKLKTVSSIDDIFSATDPNSYYLQTFLYSCIVADEQYGKYGKTPVSPALLYIQFASKTDDPTLYIDKQKVTDIRQYSEPFMRHIENVANEIFCPSIDFSHTTIADRCRLCPFAKLCQ